MTNPTTPAPTTDANGVCDTVQMRPSGSVIGTGLVDRSVRR